MSRLQVASMKNVMSMCNVQLDCVLGTLKRARHSLVISSGDVEFVT